MIRRPHLPALLLALAVLAVGALAIRGPSAPPADVASTVGPAAVAAVVAAPTGAPPSPTDGAVEVPFQRPPPTEHWLADGAETRNKQRRKAWFRELHKTPPGVDYKVIERANGRAQLAKRNALAAAEPRRDGGVDQWGVPLPVPVWEERGSDNQAGRMHVAVHSPDHDTLYAGSALGAIWKRPLDGGEWTPIGDNLFGGAHWLAVLPPDDAGGPPVVLAGTDWGQLARSADDGATWQFPDGLNSPWWIRRLRVTSDGSHTVFVVTGSNWQYRLLRSTDGGKSFHSIRDLGDYDGDLWTPRTGESTLYLLDDGELLVSEDLGDSWEVRGTLPVGSEQAELCGSEAGGPRLYAIVDESQLLRSADGGQSWYTMHAVEDYWRSLEASVVDPDRVAWGGVEVHVSDDGGQNFEIVNGWGDYYGAPATMLHADIPGLDVVLGPDGEEIWYISTDGGLYHSLDGLDHVQNLSLDGLRVSQYYDTHTSSVDPSHVAAGAQDQGYQRTTAGAGTEGLVSFDQLLSGDYGHLVSGDGSHEFVYSVYPGFILVQIGEDNPSLGWIDFPPGENYAWLPPLAGDPLDNEAFFFAATHLYRYTRSGDEWAPERWSDRDFAESNGEYISALAFSPLDPDRAYLATNAGRLFRSEDRGRSWSKSADLGPDAHYFYGHALIASSTDVDTAWIGGSGYDGPAVWRTRDGGHSWDDYDKGLPETLVYCLAEAPDGSGRLYAGTETAAYERDPSRSEWIDITAADAPVTVYWSCEALTHDNTIRFGTYGRGIWDYRLDPDHVGCVPVQDYDGDGALCDVDCADHDPEVFPGQDDACDGVDVDCDPDRPAEVDGDGDGYLACEECDDGDAGAHPGAEEVCGNDVDEDCDGLADPCGCRCAQGTVGRTGARGLPAALLLATALVLRRRRSAGAPAGG